LPSTNAQRAPSRFHTVLFTAAGMCRVRFFAGFPRCGRLVTAAFRASVFSCSTSIALATITAGSRPTPWARRSCSCRSLSCVASSTVTRISYRRGDSGATTALRARSGARTSSPTPAAASAGPTGSGSARICDATSGRGAISATSLSRSRLLRCRALSRSSPRFSSVRCAASRLIAVRWMSPPASISSTRGNRRAVRAAVIRLRAAASDMCSRSTQNANKDEHASRRCSPRSSTSIRYARSSAVISFDRRASISTPSSTRSSDMFSRQAIAMLSTYHARKTPRPAPSPRLSRR